MKAAIASVIEDYAERYGFEPAALKAVAWVESAGTFFWTVGGKEEPPIRPEVHKFYAFLPANKREKAVRAGLAHPQMNGVSIPNSWAGRYDFFQRRYELDANAAIEATSWGIGQVMGFHWKDLGFKSAHDLMQFARSGIEGQMELMCRFIDKNPELRAALKQKNWAAFAAGYNGPAYKVNRYDVKLREAYNTFLKDPVRGDVYLIQVKLKELGLYEGDLDGLKGPKTTAAIKAFQEAAGLVVDGEASTLTVEQIDAYIAAQKAQKVKNSLPAVGAAGTAGATIAKPVVDSLSTGELINAIQTTKGVADAAHKLLGLFNLPSVITAIILAGIVGFVLYKLLADMGDDEKLKALKKKEAPA